MRISKAFSPITLTIESEGDLQDFVRILRAAMTLEMREKPCFSRDNSDIYNKAEYIYKRLTAQ